MHRIHDDDWAVDASPARDLRIEIDDSVKISNGRERFFVTVRTVEESGAIVGAVSNRLLIDTPYNLGDLVRFRKNNVLLHRTAAEREKQIGELAPQHAPFAQAYVQAYYSVHNRIPSLEEWLEYWERNCNSKARRAK